MIVEPRIHSLRVSRWKASGPRARGARGDFLRRLVILNGLPHDHPYSYNGRIPDHVRELCEYLQRIGFYSRKTGLRDIWRQMRLYREANP